MIKLKDWFVEKLAMIKKIDLPGQILIIVE